MSTQKYDDAFIQILSVTQSELKGLKYQEVPSWDSIGHMSLMNALEESFEIELEVDDIIDFSSYEIGKSILSKYDIDLE
jgi:acyl carrier protein